MSTTDALIAADLAALGREMRDRMPAVATTLAAVGATTTPRPEIDLWTVTAGRVYAQRVGRIAGATALLGWCAFLFALFGPAVDIEDLDAVPQLKWRLVQWADRTTAQGLVACIALAAIAYTWGHRRAGRTFERKLQVSRDPRHLATELLDRTDRASLFVGIAGLAATMLVVLYPTLDPGFDLITWELELERTDEMVRFTCGIASILAIAGLVTWRVRARAAAWIAGLTGVLTFGFVASEPMTIAFTTPLPAFLALGSVGLATAVMLTLRDRDQHWLGEHP